MIRYEFPSSHTKISNEGIDQINALLKELSPHARPLNRRRLASVIEKGHLILAIDWNADPNRPSREVISETIVGMATLVTITKPTSLVGQIEDVVVSEQFRGRGIGKQLTKSLIHEARILNLDYVELTSRPSRTAANQLYQSLGFEQRETNVYRLKIT